jgi:5S rRNA maturation endonuclease (ribonuclease M5)
MQLKNRLTRETVGRLKDNLHNYIEDWSSINRNKKFRCFNSSAHRRNDNDPSASIVPGTNNRYWTCFGCGIKGDIFKAVAHREGISNFNEQAEFLGRKYGVALEYEGESKNGPPQSQSLKSQPEYIYYYEDEKGSRVYKVVRKEYLKDGVRKKDFRMFSKTDSGWVPGLKDVKRYLYKLPQVLKAIAEGEVIFLVEGEKCADQIADLGLIGTTSTGGAGSWSAHSKEFVPYLKGAAVVVLPDNDESGRRYAQSIVKSLTGAAASVKVLELPNLPPKGDVVDWVRSGGTREQLLELAGSVESQGPVFERDFCYYRKGKDYDSQISNFIINPKHRVVSENQSLIAAELVTEDGLRLERVLKTEDFNDVIAFRKAVPGFELSYVGKAEELQHIKVLISKKKCPTKVGVEYTGFHNIKDNWFFVSEQGVLADTLESSEEAVLLEDCEELGTDILKAQAINKEELLALAPALFSFNTLNITSTILGYMSSLFLKGKLRKLGIKHNHLIIEGQSGSGKSSTVESVIVTLLSFTGSALNASECSNFALNRAASSSNFLPVIIDEYKPYKMGKHRVDLISNVMRNSYDGHVVMKGVATLKKNREFNARASVILCGEVGMEETANIERSLKVVFAAANHNEERRSSMKLLKKNSKLLNKLGRRLLNGGLKMSEKKLKELYDSIYENLSGKELANDRVRNSITNCMLGIALIKGVFDELQVDFEEATGVSMKDILKSIRNTVVTDLLDNGQSSKGIIEDSLETMNRMAVNRLLERDYDYDAVLDSDGDFVLRLNYGAFYDRFVKFCKDYNVSHEVLPLPSFKRQLAKLSYCKSFNKPTTFKDRDPGLEDRSRSKTFRAAVLLVEGLKAKNVDVEYMLGV